MSSFLDRIRPAKEDEVEALLNDPPARPERTIRSLSASLRAPGLSAIAEIKRRSPSRGDIRPGADPVQIALAYQAAGAAGISVLTDGPHFGGSLQDLEQVSAAVDIPVLRKDFLIHKVQLDEAHAHGADAALLMVSMLKPTQLKHMLRHAHKIGLECLVEAHSADEVRIALDCGAIILGVNNRDLRSLHIDLAVCEALIPTLPDTVVAVAESGVHSRADALRMERSGAMAILVGTGLMTQDDPGAALSALLGR
ncbi:MAG: indole-3-glycerol phosphate synthase [Cognaticolwellia sp.]|jgi:indole-3-glycerol phosphate synthase